MTKLDDPRYGSRMTTTETFIPGTTVSVKNLRGSFDVHRVRSDGRVMIFGGTKNDRRFLSVDPSILTITRYVWES